MTATDASATYADLQKAIDAYFGEAHDLDYAGIFLRTLGAQAPQAPQVALENAAAWALAHDIPRVRAVIGGRVLPDPKPLRALALSMTAMRLPAV